MREKADLRSISTGELCARWRRGERVEVIDVRNAADFAEVHVPMARSVPWDTLDPQQVMRDRRAPVGAPLYIICQIGRRSVDACERFLEAGFREVVNVEGGTNAWQEAGLPTQGQRAGVPVRRQIHMATACLVLAGAALGFLAPAFLMNISTAVGGSLESLDELVIGNEGQVRVGGFLLLLLLFGGIEGLFPRRAREGNKAVRWYGNLGLSLINSVLLRLAFPVLAMSMAELGKLKGWGLFNNIEAPYAVAAVVSVIALDFIIYLQHAVFHAIPFLWRIHRVHHTDVDLDVSSAVRFHFLEIMISMGIKLCAVVVLGPPVLAVLFFEIWLNATSLFHHSNVRIPGNWDRWLRWVVVTPDMHRVHHSVVPEETNSNFSFNLPWWDRLLGTYRAQPRAGHKEMTVGTAEFRTERDQHLHRLLLQPLMGDGASSLPEGTGRRIARDGARTSLRPGDSA